MCSFLDLGLAHSFPKVVDHKAKIIGTYQKQHDAAFELVATCKAVRKNTSRLLHAIC